MPTGYNVIWSAEAAQNVDAILAYLEKYWNQEAANTFYANLLDRVAIIAREPAAFQKSEAVKGARRSVLSKQVTIYYKLNDQKIEILFLFDNRQDPDKLS